MQRFCSVKCRREFHNNRGGFGRLREAIPKMITKEVDRLLVDVSKRVAEEVQRELKERLSFFDAMEANDYVRRSEVGDDGIRLLRRAVERARQKKRQEGNPAGAWNYIPHDFDMGGGHGTPDRPCVKCGLPDRHPIHPHHAVAPR